jgi:Predicted transcriptional regulator
VKRVQIAGHRLPEAEAEVLLVLLVHGPLLVAEVQERLPGRRRAHTTVATLLGRLLERGLVVRDPEGRGHRYRAAGTEEELAVLALEQALQGVDDPAQAVLAFVDRLPSTTRRRLRRRLSDRRSAE